MKKYLGFRILRSIVSLIIVTTITFILVFSLIPRHNIFMSDPVYNKVKAKPDEKIKYEEEIFKKVGYSDYYDMKAILEHTSASKADIEAARKGNNDQLFKDWGKSHAKQGWKLFQLPVSKQYYAVREIPIYEMVTKFYKKMIVIDHPGKVQDPKNPKLKRGYGFSSQYHAITGSGTEYKYQLWVSSKFPFIHQNVVHLDLGISYPLYDGQKVLEVITEKQGKLAIAETTFPTGIKTNSAVDIYTAKYKPTARISDQEKKRFNDNYVDTKNNRQDPSMITTSMIIGLAGIVIAYVVSILLGSLLARFKDTLGDRIGTTAITALLAIPSLATIYVVNFIGSRAFGLPEKFPSLTDAAQQPISYVLPAIALGVISGTGMILWVRRYMVDQQLSDYVKFARAKGLSEQEISMRHILPNAMLPIIQGVPAAIIFTITGATMTESIFAIPGMGKMLPDAMTATCNSLVIALVFIFTSLAIIGTILGDVAITIADPRINLVKKGEK
ncbi:MAG: ABC transporter permease [Lactobacillales bacterium]|jgi:oligopeptide transport system permease protein|nr:ABC transporter permease [Lactobacillales bacterium]